MKRSDRLIALILALQQRPETAQSLAEKLEVSPRTIIRDIGALSEMGVPVYSLSGPKGGYRLMEHYKLQPLQLNAKEALAVLFSLQTMLKYADTPFNRERWTAYDKVKAILHQDMVDKIEPLLHNLHFEVPERKYAAPLLENMISLVMDGTWVEAQYRSQNARKTILIKPIRIYANQGFWYCEAYSNTHGEYRTFRMDRFETLTEAEAPTVEILENTVTAYPIDSNGRLTTEKRMDAAQPIRVRAHLTYRGMMRAEQDPHIGDRITPISDDCWLLDFDCPPGEIDWFVRYFYALGLDAEVLEPEFVRSAVRTMLQEVNKRYNGGD